MKRLCVLLAIVFLPKGAEQSQIDFNKEFLSGLSAVAVFVELSNSAQGGIVSTKDITTQVELSLRSAGVPVAELDEVLDSDLLKYIIGFLYVDVVIMRPTYDDGTYVRGYFADLDMELYQWAILARDTSISSFVNTWGYSSAVILGPDDLGDKISGLIQSGTNDFVNDFLTVNPKQ